MFKEFSGFFVSLYKELLESTFWLFLIVLDNLFEVFGCSVITGFIPTMSKAFGWLLIISNCFTDFLFFFYYKWLIVLFSIMRFMYISISLLASDNKSIFFQAFQWIITAFFKKSNSFIIVFKDKVFHFIDWHILCGFGNI